MQDQLLDIASYDGITLGETVRLGIRPEHFSLENCYDLELEGKVVSVERKGVTPATLTQRSGEFVCHPRWH